jgi:hypothetical protein
MHRVCDMHHPRRWIYTVGRLVILSILIPRLLLCLDGDRSVYRRHKGSILLRLDFSRRPVRRLWSDLRALLDTKHAEVRSVISDHYPFIHDYDIHGISVTLGALTNVKTESNQSLQTMTFAVTPAASHPSRQRRSCLI